MKKSLAIVASLVLIALSGSAIADEQLEIGQKIYDRAFGRGCGTCHDIASNPQLSANIKAGTLTRASFEKMLKEGKGGMPVAIAEIMKNKAVEKRATVKTKPLMLYTLTSAANKKNKKRRAQKSRPTL